MPAPGAPTARLAPVALPLAAEIGAGIAVGAAGLWLATQAGTRPAAAYLLVQHLLAALLLLLRVVGAGVSVVVAQALGAGDRPAADRVARATLGAATLAGAAVAALAAAAGAPLLQVLQAPDDVRPLAVRFLVLLAPALLLDAWNQSYAAVLRAHLHGRDTLRVLLAMHALHLALAALLMPQPGPFGGLDGFAAALVASRLAGLVLHRRLWRERLGLRPAPGDWVRWPRAVLDPVVRLGWPAAAEAGVYRLCFLVSVAVAGGLGTTAVAVQGWVLQVNQLTLLPGLALGLGAEIVIGHRIGAGRLREADRLVRRTLAVALPLALVAAGAATLAAPWLMTAFTRDPAAIAAATTLLALSVVLEPGRAVNLVVINALRAAGDARFPVFAGALSMGVVLAGGSWWLGVVCDLGLVGVWIAYAADEWVRGLLMIARWRRLAWVAPARAVRRRSLRAAADAPAGA